MVGIYSKTHKTRGWKEYFVMVQIAMREPLAVGLLWREYPESYLKIVKPNGHGTHNLYCLRLIGGNAERFLNEIKPYAVVKAPQVRLALSFIAHKQRYKANTRRRLDFKGDYLKRCESLKQKMHALKKGELSGVNSVNALLTHELREYRAERGDVEKDVYLIQQHLEGVETRLRETNKARSAPEKDIVQSLSD